MSKSGQSLSFKYNAAGLRTEKTVDGVTTTYRWVGAKVTQEKNNTDTILYSYDAQGKLVSFNLNGTEYYYVRNGQGDVIGILNGAGAQVVTYVYDSWGKLVSTVDNTGQAQVGTKNPYRYRGYRYDTETGLYYLQSRYYNPDWGRFLNADGMLIDPGLSFGHNLFAYCANNPSTYYDPQGYYPVFNAKESPPPQSGYEPPKGGPVWDKEKRGWKDKRGNVWVPDPSKHGGEHWDVQYPNGGYDNIYPDGAVRPGKGPRGMFSPHPGATGRMSFGVAVLGGYLIYRIVRIAPSLLPPLWWTLPANLIMP
ncbi:MAG: tRNA(Glu)-specific nuclease WapA [Firmicutes bacterium]|nr:tRNA(Glu)-specific nuclease WapA [Bacillota bacterium]